MLSKNLKYLRLKYGFSQENIARLIGKKSFTTVQKWESGVAEPSLSVLGKLAELYHVSMDEMFYTDLKKKDAVNDTDHSDDVFSYPYLAKELYIDFRNESGMLENLPKICIPDMFLGNHAHDPKLIFMHVPDDSMDRIFRTGNIIAVKTGLAHEDLQNGDIAVIDTGEKYLIRRFFRNPEKEEFILIPESSDPFLLSVIVPYSEEHLWKIFGKAVIGYTVLSSAEQPPVPQVP